MTKILLECLSIFNRIQSLRNQRLGCFEETKIKTKWHLARCKMRNLRALFFKANACLESTEALDENNNGVVTVLEKVRKICPHYDMLSDIFSHAREAIVEEFDKELEEQNLDTDTDTCSPSFQSASELVAQIVTDDSALESEPPKFKRRRVHSSAEKLYNLEEERLALRREHLRHELEKKIRYVRLEEKKLSLEEEKVKLEKKRVELEEQQMHNDFILN